MPRLIATALTEKMISNSTLPAGQRAVLRDAATRGLQVRVSGSTRTYCYEYRSPITGKTSRVTFGRAGEAGKTLAEARAWAAQNRALVAAGRCPAAEEDAALEQAQADHAGRVTVTAALDRYEAAVVTPHARKTSRAARIALLNRVCAPWGDRDIRTLSRAMVLARLDAMRLEFAKRAEARAAKAGVEPAANAGTVQVNRAQAYLRHFLGWAHDRGLVETVVIDRVKKQHREASRERVLSPSEVAGVMSALRQPELTGTAFGDIVAVLLHTGMRKGEVAQLQARDVDLDAMTITVRAEVSKNGRSRVVPLVAALKPVLAKRAEAVMPQGYVFGDATTGKRPFSGWGKSLDRLRAITGVVAAGEEPWTLHDIRRTVATRLSDAGVDPLTIEDLLGHVTGARGGVAGIYNRSKTLERQRAALEAWAATMKPATPALALVAG